MICSDLERENELPGLLRFGGFFRTPFFVASGIVSGRPLIDNAKIENFWSPNTFRSAGFRACRRNITLAACQLSPIRRCGGERGSHIRKSGIRFVP